MNTHSTSRRRMEALDCILEEMDSIAIALSGGVDSSFLAAAARKTLGNRVMLLTAVSPVFPEFETARAAAMAEDLGLEHVTVRFDPLRVRGFSDNPVDRCYICKKSLFAKLLAIARKHGFKTLADGTNADDPHDNRPGLKALDEAGIRSPLLDSGLTKADIRFLSRRMKLKTADDPPMACLATRIPHGARITAAQLSTIDSIESWLRTHGIRSSRARLYGQTLRLEVDPRDISKVARKSLRIGLTEKAHRMGLRYVTLDLEGYRPGNMGLDAQDHDKDAR